MILPLRIVKLPNKATLSLCLLSKCSFTLSKLRFFELRKPKISSCYTTSKTKEAVHKLVGQPLVLVAMMRKAPQFCIITYENGEIPTKVLWPGSLFVVMIVVYAFCTGAPATIFLSIRRVTLLSTSIRRLVSCTSLTVP